MVWPDDVPQELSVKVAEDQPLQPSHTGSPLAVVPSPNASSAVGGKGKRAARLVETAPDGRDATGKKKSAKKKKDGGRPLLMALPSPPPSDPRPLESARDKKDERRADKRADDQGAKPDSKRGGIRVAPELAAAPSSSKDLSASKRDAPDSKRGAPASAGSGQSAAAAPRAPTADLPTADVPGADLRDDDVANVRPVTPAAVGPSGRPKRELPPYLRVVK
jgi:hypothetical protein